MSNRLARWAGFVAVVAGVAGFHAVGSPSTAQDAPTVKVKNPLLPVDKNDVETSFLACSQCHNEKYPIDVKGNRFAKLVKSHEFVLLGEGRTWNEQDPHSKSFDVLRRPLGQQMSKLLKYDVTKAPQCLTCHAIDKNPGAPLPALPEEIPARFDRSEGVTCSACHGIRKPWQTEHFADKEGDDARRTIPWRIKLPAEKEQSGLRNLRDPGVKANLCASCHVGSAVEHKVVTHEMYAAGHPPLPPFELGTFMECQPKHWGYPINPELKFFTPKEFEAYAGKPFVEAHPNWTWELYRFHPADQEVYLARAVAAGAVASLGAEMRMIAADADAALVAEKQMLPTEGVDYARFDCYACHHDLRVPSDRQARGYEGGKPGRPTLKAWVAALPGVVATHAVSLPPLADTAKTFDAKWAAVRMAAVARPFGDPKQLSSAAADMAKWCDEFVAKSTADGKPLYTQEQATKLLAVIGEAATSPKWTADPEAAMHLTWAYITLKGGVDRAPVPDTALESLKSTIPVRVRFPPYSTPEGEPQPAGVQIGPRLELFRKYQSKDFIEKFKALTGGK
jgi:hypothetical protein